MKALKIVPRPGAAPRRRARPLSVFAEEISVVILPGLRIAQHFVRRGQLGETFIRLRVVRVQIRMILFGEGVERGLENEAILRHGRVLCSSDSVPTI